MIKIGILGAAGYTGGELIRILLNHPEAEIVFANSESNAGNLVSDVHEGLIGDTDLCFTDQMPFDKVDVVFFCFGHGKSEAFLKEHTIPDNVKIIDLAQDFRIKGNHDYVYGLPEIYRSEISACKHLANPGCFATCIQLVEPDRLSNPNNAMDTKTMRGGIEIDKYGAPVAYHIRKNHPGDYWIGGANDTWERIPAYTDFGRRRVLHVHDVERIGQTKGKPILTSIMPMFKMLDHYERSELQAAIVNAMIAAFIETPMDAEGLNELFGGDSNDYLNAKKDWKVKLEGGSIIPIFPGDKIAPFTPSRPNSAYGSFIENVLRHIGT